MELVNLNKENVKVAYQKIVSLQNHQPIGVEALCRIQDNNILIHPSYFIDNIERNGNIEFIDLTVLEKAVIQIYNTKLMLFSNISVNTLKNQDAIEKIINIVKKYDVKNRIYLEITERIKLNNLENITEIKNQLKQNGIKLAFDDFGAGETTFSYLKQIKPDLIKIDGEIINNLFKSKTDFSIFLGITTTARELSVPVLAEWIEDYNTLIFLSQYNVHYAQGFLFGYPTFNLQV